MIKRRLKKCQLGQNGLPITPLSMWNTNVPNFNNPYISGSLSEDDDWHHNVDNIPFPGEGMIPLDPKNSKYFPQETNSFPPQGLWDQNANINSLPPQSNEGVFNTNQSRDPISPESLLNTTDEEKEEKSKITRKPKFGFNPQMYANLQGLNGIIDDIGNLYQQGQQAQNRIDMSPLSGLQYANGRSDQSKYGYSFQKGGYTVKKGDNLTEIAKKYNVNLNDLLRVNYIQNKDLIHPGQNINLPNSNKMSASVGLPKPVIKSSATIGIPKEKPNANMSASLGSGKRNLANMSAELGNPYPKVKMAASIGVPNTKQNIVSSNATLGLPGHMSASVGDPSRKNVIKGSAELSPFPTFKFSGAVGNPDKLSRDVYEKKIFESNFSYDSKKFMDDPNVPQLVKDMYTKEVQINPNKKANIIDKANNTQYITQNDGTIKPIQVITGKSPNNPYTKYNAQELLAMKDATPYKVTPEGKFALKAVDNLADLKTYDENIFTMGNLPTGYHQLYDEKVRGKWMNTGNPKDRYGSYGCVNCNKKDFIKHIKSNFSPSDSVMILNSDKSFDHFQQENLKNRKLESGGYLEDEDDFLFGDESNYKQNNAEDTERITSEEVVEETSKRQKYDFSSDPLGLFGKRSKRVRGTSSQDEAVDYEPAQTNTTENQSFAFNYLQQKGMQPHQAAGVVGNFTQESNMNPGITNSIGAFGAGQWLGPRKEALMKFAKSKGQDPSNLQTQLDFTLYELQTTERKAGNALLNTKTSAEAARVFRKMYERPGEHEANDKRRIQEAKKLHPYQDGGIHDNNGYLTSNLHNFTNKKVINSNHITTQGMAFPIEANGVPLYPNTGDYLFPTNKVTEKPLFQQGGPKERTFWNTATQFIPYYEQYLDVKDVVKGAVTGNKTQMNQGIIGMGIPFSGKAITGATDYLTEKTLGKKIADQNESKRNGILDMSTSDLQKLYVRYGPGGYDKWSAEGFPKLQGGGIKKFQQGGKMMYASIADLCNLKQKKIKFKYV